MKVIFSTRLLCSKPVLIANWVSNYLILYKQIITDVSDTEPDSVSNQLNAYNYFPFGVFNIFR